MSTRLARIGVFVIDLLAAVSAVGGGIAILVGTIQFPSEWLSRTPFASFTGPALILALVVGGSALVAAGLALLAGRELGVLASLAAGAIMMGWVVGETVMLGYISWLQPVMFGVGILMLLTAGWWWIAGSRQTTFHPTGWRRAA
ncbi:MAG TPA: hypothetical protein VF818_04135 [Ktedonobacterales bacterium]